MFNYQNSIFKFVFVILILSFFIGCFSKNEISKVNDEYPSWYLNPISSDSLYLYGIGEGENLDEARKNALVSISSNLMLSINSSSTLKKESVLKYREYVSKEYKQNIQSNTENISFQNYETINLYKQRYNKFLVNVRVKKSDLTRTLKSELKLLNDDYMIALNSELDDLSRYLKYKSLYFDLTSFSNKVQISKTLDRTFDDRNFYNKLNTLKTNLEKLKQQISFTIYQNNSDEFLVSEIKKAISNYGFSIKNSAKYQIHLNSNFNFKDARGIFIANNLLSIEFIYKNKIIKSSKYELTGYSSNSIDDAIFNSYEELNLELF